MKLTKCVPILMILGALLAASPAFGALAWPDQPPDKATISGPGLEGEVVITDPEVLQALRLGAFEDFERGALAGEPAGLGEGYRITRYFDSATFNFATLYYFTGASGTAYVRFEDGPYLTGDHTPYNGRWLYVTPQGQAAMQRLLPELGIRLPPAVAGPQDSAVNAPLLVLVGGLAVLILAVSVLRQHSAPFVPLPRKER